MISPDRTKRVLCEAWDREECNRSDATWHESWFQYDATFICDVLDWAEEVARTLASERWADSDYPDEQIIAVAVTPEGLPTLCWEVVVTLELAPRFLSQVSPSVSTSTWEAA